MQALGHLDTDPRAPRALVLAFLDVLLIVAAAVVLLPQNLESLFSNTDAELYYALDRVGREFGSTLLFSNFNPAAVLGTLMSQLNPFLHPIHYLWYSTDNLVVPYVFLAALLYLATFSLGRALHYPVFPSRLAGYAMSVFWVPFYGPFSVDIMARLCPWATYIVCVQVFAWSLFVVTGTTRRILHDLALCAIFCAVFAYAFLVEASYAALSAPFSAAFFGAILVSSASKKELALKSFALLACLLFLIAIDLGQILSTATQLSTRMADYTGHNLPTSIRSYLTSLLRNDYHTLTDDTLQAVPYLKALALIGIGFGLCAFLFLPRVISRRLFCVTLAAALCFFALYAVSREYMVSNVIWPWPAPAYFEWIGHPIYALSGFAALYFLARMTFPKVVHASGWMRHSSTPRPARILWPHIAFFAFAASIVLVANEALLFDHKNTTIRDVTGVLPPAWVHKDELTDALANEIAISRDGEYRGSLLSTRQDSTSKRSYQMRNFVPMMVEYQRGDTLQSQAIRNLILQSPFERHVELLRLFGIRYVQYPQPAMHPSLEPARLDMLGAEAASTLYRVADPNLAGYTPTAIERVEDWKEFVDAVAARGINWRTTVFFPTTHAARINGDLTVPNMLGRLVVTAEGLRFQASSPATSLVVLPRSFSNCYRWRPARASTGSAQIVRANFVQLAVLLRGEVQGTIVADMAWGSGADCLAKDVADLYRFGVRAVKTPKDLHPNGYLGRFGGIIAARQQASLRRMVESH